MIKIKIFLLTHHLMRKFLFLNKTKEKISVQKNLSITTVMNFKNCKTQMCTILTGLCVYLK